MKTKITLLTKILLSFLLFIYGNIIAQSIDEDIPSTNGPVKSVITDGEHIYIGGDFTEVGGEPRELLARLNLDGTLDTSWDSPLGGADGGQMVTMIIDTFTNELYVGGFLPSGKTGIDSDGNEQNLTSRAARIDINSGAFLGSLTGLGSMFFPNLNSISFDENFVYVGGSNSVFKKLDKNNNFSDVTWNGSYTGNSGAMLRDGNSLYVSASANTPRIFKTDLNGTLDQNFQIGIEDGIIDAIASDEDYVYVGGNFTEVDNQEFNRIARFDKTTGNLDTSWNPNVNNRVYSIAIDEDDIYIGGNFSEVGGVSKTKVAKIDKATGAVDEDWGVSVGGTDVRSVLKVGDNVFIGGTGTFSTNVENLAKILSPAPPNLPVFTSASAVDFAENSTDAVLDVEANDGDGGASDIGIIYALSDQQEETVSSSDDNIFFTIDQNTGMLSFKSAPDFETPADADGNNNYEVTVSATDADGTSQQTITVTVTDVADNLPVFTSASAVDFEENSTDAVLDVEANDGDGGASDMGIIYALSDQQEETVSSSDDNNFFTIDQNTGVLTFKSAPDFETPTDADGDNNYEVTVYATDVDGTSQQVITVTVMDDGGLEVLIQIGLEADDPNLLPSAVTVDDLLTINGLQRVNPNFEEDYQNYIDENPNKFSSPATLQEVQDMIDTVEETLNVRSVDAVNINIIVYPNPAQQELNIEASGVEVGKVIVYTITGSRALEGYGSYLNVSQLSSGVYLARLESVEGTPLKVVKFIKE